MVVHPITKGVSKCGRCGLEVTAPPVNLDDPVAFKLVIFDFTLYKDSEAVRCQNCLTLGVWNGIMDGGDWEKDGRAVKPGDYPWGESWGVRRGPPVKSRR